MRLQIIHCNSVPVPRSCRTSWPHEPCTLHFPLTCGQCCELVLPETSAVQTCKLCKLAVRDCRQPVVLRTVQLNPSSLQGCINVFGNRHERTDHSSTSTWTHHQSIKACVFADTSCMFGGNGAEFREKERATTLAILFFVVVKQLEHSLPSKF